MKLIQILEASVLLVALVGCQRPTMTKVQGHLEEFSEEQLNAADGTQHLYPEHYPARGVIVSDKIDGTFSEGNFLQILLDTGISEVTLITDSVFSPEDLTGADAPNVRVLKDGYGGTVWARDWSPLTAIGAKNSAYAGEDVYLDFNYYAARWRDDSVPRVFAEALSAPRVSVPVYNEGGNFMVNGQGLCLMASRVSEANAKGAAMENDLVLDEAQIADYYTRFGGCSKVRIFPRMPIEGTGHIDLWAKFVSDDTVLVNQLTDETIATITESSQDERNAREIQAYLEERAVDMETMGLNVVRIPMPAPKGRITRSYMNSLLLNGHAIVPVYAADGIGETPDNALLEGYEQQVREAYESAGFKFVPVNSDLPIRRGGAVHCVTMQYGRAK
jgi:agmatine/peptidylarginine deiminase